MINEFHIITAFPKTVTIVTRICIELQEQLLKERAAYTVAKFAIESRLEIWL